MAAYRARSAAGDAGGRFLHGGSSGQFATIVPAFRKGLSEAGYVEGRNVTVEYLWAEGQ